MKQIIRRWFHETRDFVDHAARSSPSRLAIVVFSFVILVFTALLSLPASAADGNRTHLVDSLFTATSAVTVTGLTTVNTAEHWSTFGHVVILIGIKIGGLGVMTLASLLGMAISRRLGLTQRLLTASETKTNRLGEVGSLLTVVIITSTVIEIVLWLSLLPRFLAVYDSVGQAFWHSGFYAVSAFNNAGFFPTENGLLGFEGEWAILLPLMVGVFIGSLGFPVIMNLIRSGRNRRLWNLHTKLTLLGSVALFVVGVTTMAALEWNNPNTLGSLTLSEKILNSLFFGVMPRSGGFSTVNYADVADSSLLITDTLMFVGGGSAGTAGGIKVTTLLVLLVGVIAEARGDRDAEVFGRRIPRDSYRLAVGVSIVGAIVVLVSTVFLLELTGLSLRDCLFEVTSAFGTVGLSTGITSQLPDSGKILLAILMFSGRIGTITLAAALALRNRRRVIRLPEERPIIG